MNEQGFFMSLAAFLADLPPSKIIKNSHPHFFLQKSSYEFHGCLFIDGQVIFSKKMIKNRPAKHIHSLIAVRSLSEKKVVKGRFGVLRVPLSIRS